MLRFPQYFIYLACFLFTIWVKDPHPPRLASTLNGPLPQVPREASLFLNFFFTAHPCWSYIPILVGLESFHGASLAQPG